MSAKTAISKSLTSTPGTLTHWSYVIVTPTPDLRLTRVELARNAKSSVNRLKKPVQELMILRLDSGTKLEKKVTAQYITRAEEMAAERALQRRQNQFEKETAKYEKIKKKMEEKKAKEENKALKKADWEQWREKKRQENEAARAQRKQEKKDRKAAAKAAKELRKQQREQKRALADKNKVIFSFYADLEEHYAPLCPDLFLIKDNAQARRFKSFKMTYTPSE